MKKFFMAIVRRGVIVVSSLLPIDNKKVVFDNFNGCGFAGNPKYIALEFLKRWDDFRIIWLIDDINKATDIPNNIQLVKKDSVMGYYHLETAKIWVDNVRKGLVIKRAKQLYIQSWHGLLGIKKVEGQVGKKISNKYVRLAKDDSRAMSIIISPCGWYTKIMEQHFWIDKLEKIKEFGSPEYDYLFSADNGEKERIREKLNLNHTVKVLLYAPTFRNSSNYDYFNIDFCKILETLSVKFGGKWILLVRLHPNIKSNETNGRIDCKFIDVTEYEDAQELILISDAILTDYSSMIFGSAILHRPCFMYAPDFAEYKNERDFEFNEQSLPFDVSKNESELVDSIMKYDQKSSRDKIDLFMKKIGMIFDGSSSKRVVDWIQSNL